MVGAVAIAALGFAVANNSDDEASVEERFRILYALGDKAAAYKLLFASRETPYGHISDARRELLKPLLFKLTEQMQGEKTLEGLMAVFEEIKAVLIGWSSWKPVEVYRANVTFLDIVARRARTLAPGRKKVNQPSKERRSLGYQVMDWSLDSPTPSATADTPIWIDLAEMLEAHPAAGWNAWRLRSQVRLLGWDEHGRVLSVRQVTDEDGSLTDRFEISSVHDYLSQPL